MAFRRTEFLLDCQGHSLDMVGRYYNRAISYDCNHANVMNACGRLVSFSTRCAQLRAQLVRDRERDVVIAVVIVFIAVNCEGRHQPIAVEKHGLFGSQALHQAHTCTKTMYH